MTDFVVIRDYKPGDERACQEIVREATMSTVNTAFISGLSREITFQMMILMCALMFIFLGVPFFVCLSCVPGGIVLMYLCVWSSHMFKAIQLNGDMTNIPRIYMSSEYTGFWVAEVYEKLLDCRNSRNIKYTFIKESDAQNMDFSSCRRRIVGTIAIIKSKTSENSAWLRRMGVLSNYRRKGIASALVSEVMQFCADKGYEYIELVTSECHDEARDLYFKKGFELKQMYHKQIVGSLVTILMYELMYKLKTVSSP